MVTPTGGRRRVHAVPERTLGRPWSRRQVRRFPTYQNRGVDASDLVVPEHISVALAEIAASAREGLLAVAVGAGLQVMQTLIAESVTAVPGSKGRHDADRAAVRHGSGAGSVILGGRRVPVRRPRVRAVDVSGELPMPAYELFAAPRCSGGWRWSGCWPGCRRGVTRWGLERVGDAVERTATGTGKSTVSRRFVVATESAVDRAAGREPVHCGPGGGDGGWGALR